MQWRSKFKFRERPTLPQPPAVPAAQTLSHAIRSFHHGYGDDGSNGTDHRRNIDRIQQEQYNSEGCRTR